MSTDEIAALRPAPTPRAALLAALRSAEEWRALARFCLVGASGYAVNLAVFAAAVHGADVPYRLAAVIAFAFAVTSNFAWNRRWTFRAHGRGAGGQALRFLLVSLVAFGFSLLVLQALVEGAHAPRVVSQAVAIALATPLSFAGNRAWTFRERAWRARRRRAPSPPGR
jgi:dolichol-phosphate mannosyltransferase